MSRSRKLLGCYVLPGGVTDPRVGLEQARAAEQLGLGAVWIGERYDTKDLPSLAGAIGQVTERVAVGAAVTHPGLRHPMVLASMGQTLQSLTGGRFRLGLGRSAAWRWRQYGAPVPTLASLGDTADLLRRLWRGETVSYQGPAGDFPELRLAQRADVTAPPLLLAAIGPKTLALAGRAFDGVLLHPFLTPDGVRHSIAVVRDAAGGRGSRPGIAALRRRGGGGTRPVAHRHRRSRWRARAAGYLQLRGLGDALAAANGWSADDLARYRAANPRSAALGERSADKALPRDELVELSRTMPRDWLPSSSAVGGAPACARRLHEYVDAGADELLLHGTTAEHLDGLAAAFAGSVEDPVG